MVKIWGRGTGQASFNLTVQDGKADLQLYFKLALLCDAHFHQHQQHPGNAPQYQHEKASRKKKKKGPSRHEKDRVLAAAYQARHQSGTEAIKSVTHASPRPNLRATTLTAASACMVKVVFANTVISSL